MIWFIIEVEILLYGKETEIVQSYDKDSALIIAKRNLSKRYSCSENDINVISCKKNL